MHANIINSEKNWVCVNTHISITLAGKKQQDNTERRILVNISPTNANMANNK